MFQRLLEPLLYYNDTFGSNGVTEGDHLISKLLCMLALWVRDALGETRRKRMKTSISTPWVELCREFEALFGGDPDVRVEYVAGDGESPVIKLFVDGLDKGKALTELLPAKREFGNVTVGISVVVSNSEDDIEDTFRKAFEGNPALSYVRTTGGGLTFGGTYVVFRNRVVQYFNDNLGDINGNESTLYEDIAKDIFDGNVGVFFCTDLPENLGITSRNA